MDAVWIKVFVLTLSECVAPAGKTVCQEQQLEMQFLAQAECEAALQQLLELKDQSASTIVNRDKSGCTPSARQADGFPSADAVKAASDAARWHEPNTTTADTAPVLPHAERLANLSTCEESLGIAPCKLGDIIVEAASSGKQVEVWRRSN
ncbi:MAG: hypothetical protein OEW64_00075 [Gammaproteobacteria bacterium]|nr:hypothetical protein [Gammaproteobacteria bacterium]MDH5302473.1 hypothetical protein [Gammaproteobacteria bacterium]MDH5321355.1 hypothetical protein [Gammaproteobacteria bacterium]